MPKTQKAANTVQEAAQTAAEQLMPMKVDVKISSIRPEGNLRA
jgi:stage V sporulation protein G